MKFFRDVFIGVVLGLLFVGGICYTNPYARKILQEAIGNISEDAKEWAEETAGIDFTELTASGSEVAEGIELADSGITGEGSSFSETMYPYYAMLNEDEKRLYAQLYANAREASEAFKPVVEIDQDSLQKVFQSVFYDHPELFWMDTSYSYKYIETGKLVEVDLKYNETFADLDQAKAAFDAEAGRIIVGAQAYLDDAQKEEYVHNAICNLVVYDLNASMNQSAYSALVNHATVCAGYARSFQYIMQQLGIPTYYCVGTSQDEDHAWNLVWINGTWKNVDPTWDDTEGNLYRFYNKSDAELADTHTRTGMAVYLPQCY